MLLEKVIPPFSQWIGPALAHWGLMMLSLVVCAYVVGYLFAAVNHGPLRAFSCVGHGTVRFLKGIAVSPRRVWAIAWLSIQEAIRKKVLIGFMVFIVVLMMLAWYLDTSSVDPARLYLSAVMTWSSYMILLLMLVLSAFAIPSDIKTKTVFTVTTKPVHPSELVLGRVVGFTTIGTAMLAIMCVLSYLFVNLGLSHTHTLTPEDLSETTRINADGVNETVLVGETRRAHGHAHPVEIFPNGASRVDTVNKHSHDVAVETIDDITRYRVSHNRGSLVARVPLFGKLSFRDRSGLDQAKGINVGDEWQYRSFIAGGTPAAAIWTYDSFGESQFPPRQFPDGIPVEMTIGVFRSHKGDIEKRVLGSLALRNPETGLMVEAAVFQSEEFATKSVTLPYLYPRDGAQIVQRKRADARRGTVQSPSDQDIDQSILDAVNLHFDFGTATSPVADGYERVTATTAFDIARGYGWSSGQIDEIVDETIVGDDRAADDNRTSDGVFSVDLPNGNYLVAVRSSTPHEEMVVTAEDREVAPARVADDERTRSYLVAVADGRLDLRIEGASQAAVTSLSITNPIDVFRDLVSSDGQIEIWLKCVDNAQYFGAAQADLYIHAANASVPINFVKGFFGIWQQMVLVIAFGVMFSTFLSGAVALIATAGAVFIAGFFRDFLIELAQNQALGGGPLEAFWRLITGMNLMTEMPSSLAAEVVQSGDKILRFPMQAIAYVIPPLSDFSYVEPVASGFDVPMKYIQVHGVMTLGYLIPVLLAAYLFFSNREVAK